MSSDYSSIRVNPRCYKCEVTSYCLIYEALDWFEVEAALNELECIRLAVKNSGTCADQDVSITIETNAPIMMMPADFTRIDQNVLERIVSKYSINEFFGIPRTINYLDYYSAQKSAIRKPSSINSSSFPIIGGRQEKSQEDLINEIEEDLDVYFAKENNVVSITIDFDEIMHNTAVAFPTVLFVNGNTTLLNYSIKSRNMPDVYYGDLTVKGIDTNKL